MISVLGRFVDFLCPRACLECGCRLGAEEDVVCLSCNMHLDRTNYAKNPYDNEMAKLFWKLLPIEKATAMFFYHSGDNQSKIIYDIKYYDRDDIGIKMGTYAAKEIIEDEFFDGIDVIVPVPLAKNRLRQRGYNQSEMIALGISDVTRIPVVADAVIRDEFVKSQTHLSPMERRENVDQIFHLEKAVRVKNKHVLIVDDVCTSGSTIRALGTEICKAGNVKISVFVLGFTHS